VIDVIGQRVRVASATSRAVYEVRLTFHEGRWMARILTLPDTFWSGWDGRGVRVFHASSPDEVERLALKDIKIECERRGQKVLATFKPGLDHSTDPPARRVFGEYPLRLLVQSVPKRGTVQIGADARTANLSESGLFVVTREKLIRGSIVSMVLRLPGLTERLRAKVVWSRPGGMPWFPQGTGVELVEPPLSYRASLQGLR